MIYFPLTIKQLRQALDGFPDDMPVTRGSDLLIVELVFIDGDGNVVGTDAEDYRPKPGERAALLFS